MLARDAALPGLRAVLDADAFLETLRGALPELRVTGARRLYLRYKPGAACLVAWRAEQDGGDVDLYARAHAADAAPKLGKALARSGARLAGCGIALFRFPDDRRLPLLRDLVSPGTRAALLARLLPREIEASRCELSTLHYKPERRWVGLARVDGEPRAALKVYTAREFRGIEAAGSAIHSGSGFRVPRVIGAIRIPRGAIASEWADGAPLGEAIAAGRAGVGEIEQVGAGLAELHALRPERLPHRSAERDAGALASIVEQVGFMLPGLAGRCRALLARVAGALGWRGDRHAAIHGDFYAKQVLVGSGAPWLLDLDHAAWGPAAADLGSFAAHLELDAARGRIAPERAQALAEALLRGHGCQDIARARVELHTCAALVGLLHHPFRHCDPDWEALTEALLARAEGRIEASSAPAGARLPLARARATKVAVEDAFGVTDDEAMPWLREALRPEAVERELAAAAREAIRPRLRAIRVLRHKPGRRAILEYQLDVDAGAGERRRLTVLGKSRARGLDATTYEMVRALADAGLGPANPSGVSISEPLGVIARWSMWLQRKVPGPPAAALLEGPEGPVLAARIAHSLHALHAVAIPCARRHGLADELALLRDRLERVATERGTLRGRIERLADACEELATLVVHDAEAGIHRDFHPDQVIVEAARLHIVDLDLYARGDPALDAGNFLAHVVELALRRFGHAHALRVVEAAFLERFLELAGEQRRRAVEIYRELSLARHVFISTRFESRRPLTEPLLELCEARLGLAPALVGRGAPAW